MAEANATIYASSGPEKVLELAKESVRILLKDPSSAEFRSVRMVEFNGGPVVCGAVNARNSYGGYVGFKLFVAGGGFAKIWETSKYPQLERDANAGITAACS